MATPPEGNETKPADAVTPPATPPEPQPKAEPPAPAADDKIDPNTVIEFPDPKTGEKRIARISELITAAHSQPEINPDSVRRGELWDKVMKGDQEAIAELTKEFGQSEAGAAQAVQKTASGEPLTDREQEIVNQFTGKINTLEARLSGVEAPLQQMKVVEQLQFLGAAVNHLSDKVPFLALNPDAAKLVKAHVDAHKANLIGAGQDPTKLNLKEQQQVVIDSMLVANQQLAQMASLYGVDDAQIQAIVEQRMGGKKDAASAGPPLSDVVDNQGAATTVDPNRRGARLTVDPLTGAMTDAGGGKYTQDAIGNLIPADVPSASGEGGSVGPASGGSGQRITTKDQMMKRMIARRQELAANDND